LKEKRKKQKKVKLAMSENNSNSPIGCDDQCSKPSYKVGDPMMPLNTDEIFSNQIDAENKASSLSKSNGGNAYAVWDNKDNVVCLYMCFERFVPSDV